MARLSYYLDVRYAQKDGKHALKLRISARKKKIYLPLGEKFVFSKDEWDAENQIVLRRNPQSRAINQQLTVQMRKYEAMVEDKFGIDTLASADDIYACIVGEDIAREREVQKTLKEKDKPNPKSIKSLFELHISRKVDKPKSAESYQYTLILLTRYINEILKEDIAYTTFDTIDHRWLDKFYRWMKDFGRKTRESKLPDRLYKRKRKVKKQPMTSLSINTCAIHMENFRAVNNLAKDYKMTMNYAFDRYIIQREEVIKYTMGFAELRKMWATTGSNQFEEYYLDIFKIIFGLCGINVTDLYNLKDENIHGNRVEFFRQKTNVFGSIRIEPEIKDLILKHRGTNGHLLDISEKYSDPDNFTKKMNDRLKLIGEWHWEGHNKVRDSIYWPKITTYTARYSWATAAGMEDISYDTIDMGLTHKGRSMTDVYVRRYWRKLDEANRRVLDIVTGKAEPTYAEDLCENIFDV